ncbi:hypothetical protein A2954_00535 [Candidatus Roizmanbacteria bacterium RIFCSPLOWO2_01_FULL_37_12]|uniref:Uncharacterized protein n=1 Tax=Candidatus Roizmanbacteria bacterium RIFCSPLOWO2_01_FULL_37_12 TaxID=1802056 RepID=A0A1F7I9V6_9BACT|nr:MAG: hypothetical protein A3D76_00890 [Candidatus Roizmanbacteria bacterium RIFCSPHIGHO2_02_FULL_37_9b]OGK40112.1 MAG: hypothetical protein A2954_00535 [Candidatus Roizmanbacteria bacterium RIFCSPLOWO2_01_FULL_37_12]
MKKFEKKILKGIYTFETKQTLLQLILRLLAIVSFSLGGVMWIYIIIQKLIYQETLDLFEIFKEDLLIIRENFWEVIGIFSEEAPVIEILLAICTVILSIFLILNFIQNFAKVKHKLDSIIRFWLNH